MRIAIADNISEFDAHDWNALAGSEYPFLRHEFLTAAETSGSAAPQSGWIPRHIGMHDSSGRMVAAMPLYEKSHSWGEFVFDWSWAQAYERAGLDYYPKLVSTVPFTPAPSPRLLTRHRELHAPLLETAQTLANEGGYSSLHILFPQTSELASLETSGLKIRKDCQFHWYNQSYSSFDEFLSGFSASKRKKVRRDRRHVAEQGISFRRVHGKEADAAIWRDVYELINISFLRRGSLPYFSLDFFLEVSERLPDNILIIIAEKSGSPIGAAVFYDTTQVLYGRYWGADANYNALHFETCYYQGIDYCIDRGIRRFEPGTQGEHKISRGFVPVNTWSAHWLAQPEFSDAIGQFLTEESRHVDHYIDVVNEHTPYKDETTP